MFDRLGGLEWQVNRQMLDPGPRRQLLFGVFIDGLQMHEVLERCQTSINTRKPMIVGVVNAAKVVNLQRDPTLRDALLDCDVLLPDGQSVVWASRLLGRALPVRVAGIDLFEELLAVANADSRSVYLLGAKPQILRALEVRLSQRFPDLRIAGSHHGYFSDEEAPEVAANIAASGADMLFLGMGSPKKEKFLAKFGHSLGVPILHGVGGSFDVLAGLTKRAPGSWQRLGLEWAYRLCQEPGRMWRRYLVTNTKFIGLTMRELFAPLPAFERSVAPPSTSLSLNGRWAGKSQL